MRTSTTAIAFGVASLGIAAFSLMDAVMKGLSLAIGAYNALLWRTLAAALIAGAVFLVRRQRWPHAAVIRLHLQRGVVSAAMAMLFFWGLARVPLAQGVALSFVAPLIALYLAAMLLKERVERRTVYASLAGFSGVIVILIGQRQAQLPPEAFMGALAILTSAGLYAYNIILMRRQAQVAPPFEVAFFMSMIMSGCLLVAAPWVAELPATTHAPAIFGAAMLAFISLVLLSWAYARAEAQYLAPVEYTAFIWAALFGFVVFGETVGPLTILGAAMIVVACIVAARRPVSMAEMETGL